MKFKFTKVLPDRLYIKLKYFIKMRRRLNLKNPTRFDEKLNWLKLYDRKPIYSTMVDKYAAKAYVAEHMGEQYVVPAYGVWDKFEDIDFNCLPDQFVLKSTHDCGGLVICKDKSKLDIESARKKINKSLKTNYFWSNREWPYKNVKPRVFAEKYMEDASGGLIDYKFYCSNGKVDCVLVCVERQTGNPKFYYFDKDWSLKRYNQDSISAPEGFTLEKPDCIDKMYDLASEFSKGFAFLRVDLYECNGEIYFGEATFYPDGGIQDTWPVETHNHFGDLVDLSLVKVNKKGKK